MIRYWLQNGEACSATKNIRKILQPIFQNNGKFTQLSQTFFRQLKMKDLNEIAVYIQNYLNNTKNWSSKEPCSICRNSHTTGIKGWLYPFVIAKGNFPNLHPNGQVDSLHICKQCAEKSIRAYGKVLFNGQKRDYLCFILFFARTSCELRDFYAVQQGHPAPNFYSNLPTNPEDKIYYPYEFLAYIIYAIANKQILYKDIIEGLGAIVFGLSPRSKKIYDTADIVDDLNPIINAFRKFSNKPNHNFIFLFKRLRENSKDVEGGMFINRNLFFKSILKEKKINWAILEKILFYNIGNNENIPFIKPFLITLMEELHMTEREIFEQVSAAGYKIGKSLLRVKDEDTAKRYLYELRRKRRLEEFLDMINLIQLEAGETLDDRPFKEHAGIFYKLKVFFLIGMTNAIVSPKGEDK